MAGDATADGGAGRTIEETIRDHLRAGAGGLLVGLPLLWTMEMWAVGATISAGKLLIFLGVAFTIVCGYNALSGFRRDRTLAELLVDAVQGFGLSIILSAVALLLLGQLEPELGLRVAIGRVALLAIPVAFGTALAATLLSEDDEGDDREPVGPLGRLLVAAGGALYFALNVAPTDEVRILGSIAGPPLLLAVIGASLVVGLVLVFHAGLPGGRPHHHRGSPLEHPYSETVAAYAVALVVTLFLLWAFGSTDGAGPRTILAEVIMLGMVATFGAATGRLLIGGRGA